MSDRSATGARQAWAVGGMVLAATLLIMVGIWQIFEGIGAIAKDDVFVRGVSYTYKFNLTTWGWIHLILGALMVIAGFGLFTASMWARVLGIAFAVLSAIAQFAFVPYYPLWSLTIVAVDVFIIWSLAVVRRPIDSDTW
ncbi:MAG TPA: hypothetical protein VGJ53_10140 [Micromonosporaceae bacterium]